MYSNFENAFDNAFDLTMERELKRIDLMEKLLFSIKYFNKLKENQQEYMKSKFPELYPKAKERVLFY
jgi:hypothetical protein